MPRGTVSARSGNNVEEPAGREVVEAAPCHDEDLGGGIMGVGPFAAAQTVRQDRLVMRGVENIEPLPPAPNLRLP